jgi:hypothetical protein
MVTLENIGLWSRNDHYVQKRKVHWFVINQIKKYLINALQTSSQIDHHYLEDLFEIIRSEKFKQIF